MKDYSNINKKNMVTNKGHFIKVTYKPISKRGSYPDLLALEVLHLHNNHKRYVINEFFDQFLHKRLYLSVNITVSCFFY